MVKFIAAAATCFLTVALVSQSAPLQKDPANGTLQQIVVTVLDDNGRYVRDLKADDFVLEENGIRQQVTGFAQDSEVPISLGILIDKSASMRLPLAVQGKEKVSAALLAADGAARVLVKLMKPQDEFLLMTFDEGLKVKQAFTTDQKKIVDLLYKNNQVGGSTHLYHAVSEALKQTKKAKNRKRALVVITDVHDTSGDKLDDLKASLHDAEVPVYTFGMRWDAWGLPGEDPAQPTFEVAVLRQLAVDSGGRSIVVDIPDLTTDFTVVRMIGFVQDIAAELRGQYTLKYYSNAQGTDAEKAIRIRAVSPEYQVRFRRDNSEPVKPLPNSKTAFPAPKK
jgi:Ca-activated chloride channel family protein